MGNASGLKQLVKAWAPPVVMDVARRAFKVDPWANVGSPTESFVVLPDGGRFFLRPTHADSEVCCQVFFNEDYALRHTQRADALRAFYDASTAPIIVDAGANIGAASVWFASHFPRAKVIAVEPDADNVAWLKKNAARFPAIDPVEAAIASFAGKLVLTDPGSGAWAYRTFNDPTATGRSVPAMTIEEIVARAGDGDPFILKIDIEGAESELFSRHADVFDRFPLIAIELHDWMLPGEANCRAFLQWHGARPRDFMFHGENVFSVAHAITSAPSPSLR